jgi:dihydrofolate reductase
MSVVSLKVQCFAISIDGYGAGTSQDLEHPLGVRGRDVRLGGGVVTVRQYLRAALIDELHLAVRPVVLGAGEHLLDGIDVRALGYECAPHVSGERAMHVVLRKRA